jgi:tetratricopeptide (TPR) repeat protein
MSLYKLDFRQDLSLEWHSGSRPSAKAGTISAADAYTRSGDNEKLFARAKTATDLKNYDEAISRFQELLATDPKDFQAWSELGTVYLLKGNHDESEKAYSRSIAERPTFFLAHLNLGRLRSLRKNFEGAIEPLSEAVKIQPGSAEANYYLGEAYLQIKKGSKAVPHLNEAARLGRPEAHLRLATLYDAAKLKDRAAAEYEQFLKKRPDHEDRKKLEKYIADNKKQ